MAFTCSLAPGATHAGRRGARPPPRACAGIAGCDESGGSPSYTDVLSSDAVVVRRVVAGDTEAFAILVDRYYARCTRYAAHVVGNREDAEEAVQDAFVRAYRALGDYDERDRFSAWLFRILINQCRSVAARAARRAQTFADSDDGDAPDAFAAPGAGAYGDGDPAAHYAERDRLDRALARLRPEQREAVVLRLAEELTYEEMAVVTGAGVSALKMRVSRAVARLRELLTEVYCV